MSRMHAGFFWRYNVLYVSERCFESGGLFWDQIFSQVKMSKKFPSVHALEHNELVV